MGSKNNESASKKYSRGWRVSLVVKKNKQNNSGNEIFERTS
jgi:hypothetical protein